MDESAGRVRVAETGVLLPDLIYGSSALGNLYRELDVDTKRELVGAWMRSMEPPVAIDSAGKYGAGLALEEIGDALRYHGVPESDVVISNKLGWRRIPLTAAEPTFEPGVWKGIKHDAEQAIGYEGILACWEQGNELLGPGYRAELLSVHDPDEYLAAAADAADRERRYRDVIDAYRALGDLKRDGKAKAIGIGSKDWRVIREVAETVDFDWVMFAGSFTLYTHPKEVRSCMAHLASDGVFIINSAVFNSGFLVGSDYFDYRPVTREDDPDLFLWRDRFHGLCTRYGVKPAEACVEFGLAPAAVSSIAMNTTRPGRVADNLAAIAGRAPSEFWSACLADGLIEVTPGELR